MEQRPLRLGDIVDDYCPRERRVTNHAVVAIVEDTVRQARCMTCDTEHVFKGGREPRRRLKHPSAEGGTLVEAASSQPAQALAASPVTPGEPEPANPEVATDGANAPLADEAPAAEDGVWSSHRQLIRAQLPKIAGEQPVPRPIPEFTMHQRQYPRGGQAFRYGQHGNGTGNGNGNGNNQRGQGGGRSRDGFRHGRPGQGQGQPGGGRGRNKPPR